jgi:hypothetical protein
LIDFKVLLAARVRRAAQLPNYESRRSPSSPNNDLKTAYGARATPIKFGDGTQHLVRASKARADRFRLVTTELLQIGLKIPL